VICQIVIAGFYRIAGTPLQILPLFVRSGPSFHLGREPSAEGIQRRRATVLHITAAGKLLLNAEHEDWNGLADRLSELYRVREERTLHLMADDGVPFQTVADALDIVENIPAAVKPQAAGMEMQKLDITVLWLTPKAANTRFPRPVGTDSGKHAQSPALRLRAPKLPLLPDSAESESLLQKLFANIRGQSDFRMRTCDLCNRLAYTSVYGGCQKGVDLARIRPTEHGCHA